MNRYAVLLIIMALPIQVNALGRVIGYDELAKNFFATIQGISKCGDYVVDGEFGEYRLIQSYIYGGSMLFVDKVQYDQNALRVVAGFTFAEVNNDHVELNIEKVSCQAAADNIVILNAEVDGTGHKEELKYSFTIRLNTDSGAYQYTSLNQLK